MNILNFLKSGNHASLLKYMLMGAIGFGIGGAIWGFLLFQETLSSAHRLMDPFSYIMVSIVLGSIGGLFLALPFKNIKKILLSFILGGVGFFIAFLIGLISSYHLFFLGHYFLSTLLILTGLYKWNFLFSLYPSLIVGEFIFVFAIVGAIGGFFYSIALKKKIKPMVLAGMIGFAIGSLIGPLVGNFTEMIFESLLAAYITTFLTIGIIIGISFGAGMYLAEKSSVSKSLNLNEDIGISKWKLFQIYKNMLNQKFSRFFNKGISTKVGILIIVLVAIVAGGILIWQYEWLPEVEKEIPSSKEEKVTIISPTKTDTWVVGKTYQIKWVSSNSTETVSIMLIDKTISTDSLNKVWQKEQILNTGNYDFIIPDVSSGNQYQIYISTKDSHGYSDLFSIIEQTEAKEPYIKVLSPNGGEKWIEGKKHVIQWNQKGLEYWGDIVTICLKGFDNEGNAISSKREANLCYFRREAYFISEVTLTGKSYQWIIPKNISEKFERLPNFYKIGLLIFDNRPSEGTTEWAGFISEDESDNYFSIIKE